MSSHAKKKRIGEKENIVRHDDPRQGMNWEVRINRRGKLHRQFFADSLHGGKDAALAAAQAFRDELLARLPPALPVKTRNARNTSGVIGINMAIAPRRDREVSYIVARWPGGKASFPVEKLGFDEAWRRAMTARKKGLASLGIDKPLPELPPKGRKKGFFFPNQKETKETKAVSDHRGRAALGVIDVRASSTFLSRARVTAEELDSSEWPGHCLAKDLP